MKERIRDLVLENLSHIAPDAEVADLPGDADFREELDLDSMDFLRLVTSLHEALGVDIPEVDYASLGTLDGAVAYLAGKLSSSGALH